MPKMLRLNRYIAPEDGPPPAYTQIYVRPDAIQTFYKYEDWDYRLTEDSNYKRNGVYTVILLGPDRIETVTETPEQILELIHRAELRSDDLFLTVEDFDE